MAYNPVNRGRGKNLFISIEVAESSESRSGELRALLLVMMNSTSGKFQTIVAPTFHPNFRRRRDDARDYPRPFGPFSVISAVLFNDLWKI